MTLTRMPKEQSEREREMWKKSDRDRHRHPILSKNINIQREMKNLRFFHLFDR